MSTARDQAIEALAAEASERGIELRGGDVIAFVDAVLGTLDESSQLVASAVDCKEFTVGDKVSAIRKGPVGVVTENTNGWTMVAYGGRGPSNRQGWLPYREARRTAYRHGEDRLYRR